MGGATSSALIIGGGASAGAGAGADVGAGVGADGVGRGNVGRGDGEGPMHILNPVASVFTTQLLVVQ